jgi:protein-tyrosine phosphatase
VPFANLLNFRDAGALAGKPGRLFRSDALSNLVDESFRVHTVIDLRRQEEITEYGRAPEWACEVWHNVTLREGPDAEYDDAQGVVGFLVDRYLEMTEYGAPDLVRVFTILADKDTGPAVVHCAGGRDRTGIVMALFLDLVGVPDETIGADYQLTEQFTNRWLEIQRTKNDGGPVTLPPFLLHTPAETILTFLARLRERHGSVPGYLLASGLSQGAIDALRARYS